MRLVVSVLVKVSDFNTAGTTSVFLMNTGCYDFNQASTSACDSTTTLIFML